VPGQKELLDALQYVEVEIGMMSLHLVFPSGRELVLVTTAGTLGTMVDSRGFSDDARLTDYYLRSKLAPNGLVLTYLS
jgi:hypothetical protein